MGTRNEISVRIAYPQRLFNIHADTSRGTRGLNSGPCLYLHVHPYLVYANSEDCRVCTFAQVRLDNVIVSKSNMLALFMY